MERIEHKKKIEKWSKDNVQKLLMGNDWLKSGEYTPSRKLQENVSWFELESMSLNKFLGPAILLQAYRFIVDSRDKNKKERLKQLNDAFKLYRCHTTVSYTHLRAHETS